MLLLLHTAAVRSDELVVSVVLDILEDHGGDVLYQLLQRLPGVFLFLTVPVYQHVNFVVGVDGPLNKVVHRLMPD